jgi:hypothetical protein
MVVNPTKEQIAEIARKGQEAYERVVKPKLTPADKNKYVAIDVLTNEYEIDDDDYAAANRLQERIPNATIWTTQAGQKATYRMLGIQRSCQ